MFKNDFPIFSKNPGLVYLDSAASLQKPAAVIDGVKDYLENDYANIHRGQYALSERSEELFWQSRKKVADRIDADPAEVVFTGNSTDSVNLLALSIEQSGGLQEGDQIALSTAEHHANIVPWQMLADRIGCEVVWIGVDEYGCIKSDDVVGYAQGGRLRIVAVHMVSNVLGIEQDMHAIRKAAGDALVVVDASQAIAHVPVSVHSLGCDFLFFTGHKIGALTGIGVMRGKRALLKNLQSAYGGGGAIESVDRDGFTLLGSPDKFEPGTPNLVGAISMLKAFEYMEHVGGGSKMQFYTILAQHEAPLIAYALQQFDALSNQGVCLLAEAPGRIGLFSFTLPVEKSSTQLGQYMATKNIAIRCGGQCAHPYHASLGIEQGSCRISFWLYTELEELERFFEELQLFLDRDV